MVEKVYNYTLTNEKTIERILEDDYAGVNHMVLPKDAALPEHFANSHVYMIVARGVITLRLNDQEAHTYEAGSILTIPYQTKMNVSNKQEDVTEIFVIKAPSPKTMGK